jgi:ABC-type Fe3+-hydroxamate transport system substrate-binding protein
MHSGGWDVLSVERLSTLAADHIFALVDPDSERYLDKISQTAIWRDIPAVRTGQFHRVGADVWLGGDGVIGTEAIVDDVLAAMAPVRSEHGSR